MATPNALSSESLTSKLTAALSAPHVSIVDISGGCGTSYTATIVSPLFAKKTTLARHRLVNSTLKEELVIIHAWTVKCFTPEEWEKKIVAEGGIANVEKGLAPVGTKS
jgi:stress-induced morphogen